MNWIELNWKWKWMECIKNVLKMKWNEMSLNNKNVMRWDVMRWDEMRWNEMKLKIKVVINECTYQKYVKLPQNKEYKESKILNV